MANESGTTYPVTGLFDLFRLIGGFAGAQLRSPGSADSGLVFSNWITGVARRRGSDNFILNLLFMRLLLVTGRELSDHIMQQPPSDQTYMEGPTKARAMSFLAPQALTISHDRQWQRLRPYNEQVLSEQAIAPSDNKGSARQQAFLDQARQAFAEPVSSIDDIRSRMGRVMLGVVFGDNAAPAHLVEDIQVLFGYVQSPLRRMVLGRREKGRRERFYAALRQLWRESQGSQNPSLLASAHRLAQGDSYEEEELLQQIPHWMFTFTGSGTDLLTRTLAMVASRPEARDRALEEIRAKGPLDQAATIEGLDYLEACLLETCRLFPPVTRTLHVAPNGDIFGGASIPAGMEILHYFPVKYRDVSADPSANDFNPDRWLDPARDARSAYPNLFLSGARACPGEGLILFVCKAAIAMLLEREGAPVANNVLGRDPLPFSFPQKAIRF